MGRVREEKNHLMTVISLYRHCSAVMFEKSIPVYLQVFGFPYLTKKECKKNLAAMTPPDEILSCLQFAGQTRLCSS